MTDTATTTGAGTTTGGTTTTGTTTTTAPWHEGVIEPDVLGHAQNKGWDLTDAAKFGLAAARAHMGAEKLIGAPADQMIRLPKDINDKAGADAMWKRLGKPSEAKDYDFTALKHADGKALSADLDTAIRTAAFEANLPKDAAAAMAAGVVKHLDAAKASERGAAEAKLGEERQALKDNWKANFDANKFIASQAAKKLGVPAEAIAALEKLEGVGYAKVMEMFHSLGRMMGEANFIAGDKSGAGVMSVDQARARKSELMADKAWGAKYLAGDAAAKREMEGLNRVIMGVMDAA